MRTKTATVILLLLAILYTGFRATLFFLSGNPAVLGDTIHSLGDILTAVVLMVVASLRERKETARFPEGFYRLESLTSLLVAAIMIVTAVMVINDTVLAKEISSTSHEIVITGTAILSVVIFGESIALSRVGSRNNSPSLVAEAMELRGDALLDMIVSVGTLGDLLVGKTALIVAVIIISSWLLYVGIKTGYTAIKEVLGIWEKPEVIEEIREKIERLEGVSDVKEIRIRKIGPVAFAEIEIYVERTMTALKIGEVIKKIADIVKEDLPSTEHVIVEALPEKGMPLVAVPVNAPEIDTEVFERFAAAPYYALVGNEIIFMENPYVSSDKHRGVKIAKDLLRHGVSKVYYRNIGEGAKTVLEAGCELEKIDENIKTLRELLPIIKKESGAITGGV